MRFAVFLSAVCACAAVPILNEREHHTMLRQSFIDELNSVPEMTWKAAMPGRFVGMPIGASKDMCGVKSGSLAKLREAVASGKIKRVHKGMLGAVSIPASFDSATNWPQCAVTIGDIRDQSNCGCCWAFAAAEAATDRMCIATNGTLTMPLSAQDVCFCGSDSGCDGGMLPDAWDFIQETGVVTGAQQTGALRNDDPFGDGGFCKRFSLPHCHHHGPTGADPYPAENAPGCPAVQDSPSCPKKCDSNATAPHNVFADDKYTFTGGEVSTFEDEESIQNAIMTNGPVEAAFSVYSDFENYAGGIYKHTKGSQVGGHAIKIVGWGTENGTKYWNIANSWNKFWGENGYFRIKRGSNECGIEEQAVANSASAKWGKKTGPAPGPSPPGPGPSPHPADCPVHNDEDSCQSENGCHWCADPVGGDGFCFSFPCGQKA